MPNLALNRYALAGLISAVLFQVFLGVSAVVLPAYVSLTCLLVAALFVVLCFNPRLGLYLLIICVPVDVSHFSLLNLPAPETMLKSNCSFSAYSLLVLVVLAAWFANAMTRDRAAGGAPVAGRSATLDPVILQVVLFAGWSGLSVLWSPNHAVGVVQYLKLLINIGIFLVVYCLIDSPSVLRRAGWVCMAVGTFLSCVSLYILWGLDFKIDFKEVYWAGRAEAQLYNYVWLLFDKVYLVSSFGVIRNRGTAFMHCAELAMTMNFLIAVGVGMYVSTPKEKRKERALLAAAIVMLFSSHLTTLSRAGSVSLFVMLGFFLVTFRKARERLIKNSLLTALLIVTVFVAVQQKHLVDVAYKRLSNSSAGAVSWQQRVRWWTVCYDHFLPTTGRGSGLGANYLYVQPGPHVHNIYFSFLFDLGVVGLCMFVALILMVLKDTLPTIKRQETFPECMQVAVCGGFLAILAQGTLDLHYNIPKLWMFLGLGLATIKLVKRESGR